MENSHSHLNSLGRIKNLELSVEQFDSLFTFKEDGKNSSWWNTSVSPRMGGPLVLDIRYSIKKWKEEIFYVLRVAISFY